MFVAEGLGVDTEGFEDIIPKPRVLENIVDMADLIDGDVVKTRLFL
jgi:hypothetical protein